MKSLSDNFFNDILGNLTRYDILEFKLDFPQSFIDIQRVIGVVTTDWW